MFSSLSSPNYRLYFWGQLVSVSGTWMQTVAQSFLVLQLTDSGTDLGLATAARFVPIFLFGPWGGLVADRLDKRRVLYVTQIAVRCPAALVFGVLVGTHAIQMWMVYLLAVGARVRQRLRQSCPPVADPGAGVTPAGAQCRDAELGNREHGAHLRCGAWWRYRIGRWAWRCAST